MLVPVGREQLESLCLHCHLCFSDIFREFNVAIVGYSTGTGSENDSNAFLNQAVPGAQAEYVAFCFTFVGDGCSSNCLSTVSCAVTTCSEEQAKPVELELKIGSKQMYGFIS